MNLLLGVKTMTVYAVYNDYVGVNADNKQHIDADYIALQKDKPGAAELTMVIDDWSTRLMGEFETIKEAEQYLENELGGLREDELLNDDGDGIIALYKPGKYGLITAEHVEDFVCESLKNDVHADMSESEILELAKSYENALNSEWQASAGTETFVYIIQEFIKYEL